jgi:hypothetical protein
VKKIFLIAIAVLVGFGLLIDNSLLKFSERKIASTHDSEPNHLEKNIDFSELTDEDFSKAFKYQLMTSSRILQTQKYIGIELGNFYIKGSDNQKNFVCSKFSTLELVFQADGIAISGNIPQMKVSGPCLTGSNYHTIEALLIPYKKILSSEVQQKEFKATLPDSNEQITIQFQDVVEQWPYQWNLVQVKLYSAESSESLSLNGYEIISILGSPLTLNWASED